MSDRSIRVLLVEDNGEDARLVREALREVRNARFELVHVERLSEALRRLSDDRFDVVLLDLSLPDGERLDTVIRVHQHAKGVPVVVLTGFDDEAMAVKALREGAQDYLVKGELNGNLLARAMRYAVERKRTDEEIQRHLQRITFLRDMSLATTSTLDLRGVLDILLEKIEPLLPFSAVTVRLLNRETGQLEPIACRSLDEDEWKAATRGADASLSRVLPESHAPAKIPNLQSDARSLAPDFARKHGLVSGLRTPLIVKGDVLGVLTFITKEEHDFGDDEVNFLLTLAGQAATAIHNAQLYEDMTRLAAELATSNRVKSEFLSCMSHELRTPLTAVLGYSAMIQDGLLGKTNPEQEKALGMVQRQADDLLTMINGILQATQIEARVVRAEFDAVDVVNLLDEIKSAYVYPFGYPLGNDVALRWDYPSTLPLIQTDKGKLKQILQNLINNAIKFTEQGTISVSARHYLEAETVEFRVADTGIGIAKELQTVIFQMFQQVDSSETRNHGGVGLGLYIVKNFTELLGGKVDLASEPEKGSIFTVTFPVANGEG